MARYIVRVAKHAGLVLLFAVAAMLGLATGGFFAYAGDLPRISALDDYAPSTISRVYGAHGEIVGEFAVQRREVIPYEAISPKLKQAILAAEDDSFEQHFGLSIPRILVTLAKDIIERRKAGGASTLTQQLTRKLFLTDEKTWERKIKEAILAIQIEKRYTKNEIFTLYCNQMYFGHGVYGVQAASRLYFGKAAKDLELEEAALIAGILQGNVRQSPYVNMDAAVRRRNYTLTRMADVGYISAEEAEAARQKPIVLRGEPSVTPSIAPYFVEDVRKELEGRYGAKQLYENGLSIQTALDVTLQEAANRALDDGLRRIDKRRGFRAPRRNVVAEGQTIDGFKLSRWDRPMREGDVVPAIVRTVDVASIEARAGALHVTIDKKGFAWTNKPSAVPLVKPGDLIEARLGPIDATAKTVVATLEQPPAGRGRDPRDRQPHRPDQGDGRRLQLRAQQVQSRHAGAAAGRLVVQADRLHRRHRSRLHAGVDPAGHADQLQRRRRAAAVLAAELRPQVRGGVTLRHALEESRNVPAVKLMEQLGPRQVIAYARRLGIESPIPPYLPVALGAAEASLLEITSAYGVFPNQGVHMKPYAVLKVSDREGNVLEENRPEPKDAIRADTAYVMTSLLRGVVQRGTAARAAALNWPVGGKTGTTDDNTDAWFVGFDPDITIGVWIGLDQKKTIGHNVTGSEGALPIWIDVMKAWIGDRKEPPTFDAPGNIVFVAVDQGGTSTLEGTPGAINEAFIAGTQPGGIR